MEKSAFPVWNVFQGNQIVKERNFSFIIQDIKCKINDTIRILPFCKFWWNNGPRQWLLTAAKSH